jgi:hypothetical protein
MGGILIDEIEPIGGSECDHIDLPSRIVEEQNLARANQLQAAQLKHQMNDVRERSDHKEPLFRNHKRESSCKWC